MKDIFENTTKRKILNKLDDIWWYITRPFKTIWRYIWFRFVRRHHLVNTRLKKGEWLEYDQVMLYASFEVLKRFCEDDLCYLARKHDVLFTPVKELLHREMNEIIKYYEEEYPDLKSQTDIYKEILFLYDWWDQRKDEPYEDGQEFTDQKMLERLVKIRPELWS